MAVALVARALLILLLVVVSGGGVNATSWLTDPLDAVGNAACILLAFRFVPSKWGALLVAALAAAVLGLLIGADPLFSFLGTALLLGGILAGLDRIRRLRVALLAGASVGSSLGYLGALGMRSVVTATPWLHEYALRYLGSLVAGAALFAGILLIGERRLVERPERRLRQPRQTGGPLASLIGVAPGAVQWKRVILLFAALAASRAFASVAFVLSKPELPARSVLAARLGAQLAFAAGETVALALAFRFVPRGFAVVLASLGYTMLALSVGATGLVPPMWSSGPALVSGLINAFVSEILLVSGLALALRRIGLPGKALFVGYAVGALLGLAGRTGTSAIFGYSISFAVLDLWLPLARAAIFAGVVVGGARMLERESHVSGAPF